MYRILIVDDEALVRRGIKRSINWNELDIEMVAEAENGVEALEQVLENVPDIILLDICMPKMDGLEFASIVKQKYPQIRIVIITGFDDFEYARSALRAGVDDYILKPITREMVEAVVKTQIEKIAEERSKRVPAKPDEGKAAAAVLNAVLRREKRAGQEQELSAFLDYAQIKDQNIYFVIMKDYLSRCEIWADAADDHLAEFAILNIAGELLRDTRTGFAFETYKSELAMVVSCAARHSLEEMLMDIYHNILDFIEIPVDFGVSGKGTLADLPTLAEQAREALECTFVLSKQNIIHYGDLKEHRSGDFHYPEQTERELLTVMYSSDAEKSNALIEEFFSQLRQVTPDVTRCKSMLLRLLLSISNTMESMSSRLHPEGEHRDASFDPVKVLEQFETLEQAEEWVKKLYQETLSYVASMKSRSGQLFLKITQYIEKNYGDSDLNLKKCSEDLFLSSGYISMILKKESGKTFVDYLNEFRIERAAELLEEPESKVYEVATRVGFTHQTYFSSVFKKLIGISPKQFKEQK
ncbi:response regulator transcription factor [Christensenella intestinihominis]|uniref:response regulator transcription factor n=1 Tax=Christensenella intestinihominis TaxID=1851429 RepID=UPI00082D5926|nr:response regulator [Christensenella intestinihominis]